MIKHIDKKEQFKKLKKIFQASQKTKFYKKKYKDINTLTSFKDWQKIPILQRDELQKNSYPSSTKMLKNGKFKSMIVSSTGGSSGIARYTVLTHKEWNKFALMQAKSLEGLGISKKDSVANLLTAGSFWPSFAAVHDVIRLIGASNLPISSNIPPEKIVNYLKEFNPTVLLGLPTLFTMLADLALKQKIKLPKLRMIAYAGEHMSASVREHLRNAFGEQLELKALAYTSGDCGLMGYQCQDCEPAVYHVPTDFQFLEIYNFEENRPCKIGEEGEILVTNLKRVSMPIIRYRIGDVGRFIKNPCSCDDKNPLLMLSGRSGADFKLSGWYVSMDNIEKAIGVFGGKSGISPNFQLKLESINSKLDITLFIESTNIKKSKLLKDEIIQSIKDNIGEFPKIIAHTLDEINIVFVNIGEIQRSPITGKVKQLKDLRLQGDQR